MPILNLVDMSEALMVADRQRQGFDMLIGVLLAHLQRQTGYSDEALLEAVQAGSIQLSEQNPFDPAIQPFERLGAILQSRLGRPVRGEGLPKLWQAGFPVPGGPDIRPVGDE